MRKPKPPNATEVRYGTMLRIYDNGGRTADRYTIVPPRQAREFCGDGAESWSCPWGWSCIISSEDAGYSGLETCTPGSHLGRRIHWRDLPPRVKNLAREHLPKWAPSILEDRIDEAA